jgi:hypothetical protein
VRRTTNTQLRPVRPWMTTRGLLTFSDHDGSPSTRLSIPPALALPPVSPFHLSLLTFLFNSVSLPHSPSLSRSPLPPCPRPQIQAPSRLLGVPPARHVTRRPWSRILLARDPRLWVFLSLFNLPSSPSPNQARFPSPPPRIRARLCSGPAPQHRQRPQPPPSLRKTSINKCHVFVLTV